MGIVDIFSKRQKRLKSEVPNIYQHDEIPQALRVQIVQIIQEAIGNVHKLGGIPAIFDELMMHEDAYEYIHRVLCKEYGVFRLIENQNNNGLAILNFLLQEKSTEKTLDVVELCFRVINSDIRNNPTCHFRDNLKTRFDDAISELNERFKEHAVGYQFESNKIIRVDSEFLYSEAVKPVLLLLRGNDYKGANDEFMSAHEHYRHGRHKECLVDLNKSFESTMRSICKKRNWTTQPKDTAINLINICFQHNLLPAYLESEITALRTLLGSGIPTIRNRSAAHGQGVDIVEVPLCVTRYALNLTASTLLFLIEAEIGFQQA